MSLFFLSFIDLILHLFCYFFITSSADFLLCVDVALFVFFMLFSLIMIKKSKVVLNPQSGETIYVDKNAYIEKINDLTPFLIHIYDLNLQKYIYVNKDIDNVVSFSKEYILKSSQNIFQDIVPNEDASIFYYTKEKLSKLSQKGMLEFEFRLQMGNKTTWLLSREIPFQKDEDGNITQILGITKDVNSRKLKDKKLIDAFENLKKANEELDSFVYKASHDLRSPLGAILGLISLINNKNIDENTKTYVELMQQSVQKLIKVTDDLIDQSKVKNAKLNIEKLNIKTIILETINELKFYKNGEMIDYNVACKGEEFIYSDFIRINMIINNLIGNAIKYHRIHDNNPFIKVDIHNSKQEIKLTFEDNGAGIDEVYHSKLFDMFFRASNDSTGTGLGLYIVKSAVDKLNGKIELNSKLGVGSEFVVTLPHNSN